MASPDAKRTNVASPTEETTAEKYGRLHGIDAETQAALQNVGRLNRQRECIIVTSPTSHRACETEASLHCRSS